MNLEKVVFGFFVLLAATLNFGFFVGDIDDPDVHNVYELFAAIVGWLGRLVFRPAQPQEIPFSRRSPEDIRAWRRKAGIRLRTQ